MLLLSVQIELDPRFARYNVDMVANVRKWQGAFCQDHKAADDLYIRTVVFDALGVEMPDIVRDPLELTALYIGAKDAQQFNPIDPRVHGAFKRIEQIVLRNTRSDAHSGVGQLLQTSRQGGGIRGTRFLSREWPHDY